MEYILIYFTITAKIISRKALYEGVKMNQWKFHNALPLTFFKLVTV